MGKDIGKWLSDLPVVKDLVGWMKRIKLPGFEGLSLFDFWELYSAGIVKGTFSTRASAIAFSFFMAIFPFFLFVLNLIPFVPINNFQVEFLTFVEGLLPAQTADFFRPILYDIAGNQQAGLLSTTFLFAIFLMANGVNAIFTGFEYSYHITVNRSVIKQYFVALGVSLILALIFLTAVGIIVYYQLSIARLKVDDLFFQEKDWISEVGTFIFFISLIFTIVGTLFYFGTKQGREFRFFSAGALMTTLLFLLTTYLFGIYINNFSNYNEIYFSLASILILMVYIWLNSNLLLLGFELNAVLHHLREKRNKKRVA
ncbi:MAG: YihY/virulence factor BrkB family protein [Leeuwenhoekiella sp.]